VLRPEPGIRFPDHSIGSLIGAFLFWVHVPTGRSSYQYGVRASGRCVNQFTLCGRTGGFASGAPLRNDLACSRRIGSGQWRRSAS